MDEEVDLGVEEALEPPVIASRASPKRPAAKLATVTPVLAALDTSSAIAVRVTVAVEEVVGASFSAATVTVIVRVVFRSELTPSTKSKSPGLAVASLSSRSSS